MTLEKSPELELWWDSWLGLRTDLRMYSLLLTGSTAFCSSVLITVIICLDLCFSSIVPRHGKLPCVSYPHRPPRPPWPKFFESLSVPLWQTSQTTSSYLHVGSHVGLQAILGQAWYQLSLFPQHQTQCLASRSQEKVCVGWAHALIT